MHNRQSIRLKNYDYASNGFYFVTICTQNRAHIFGEIIDGIMIHNEAGNMAWRQWEGLKERFPGIVLHEFVIMPDHMHGIIEIVGVPLVGTLDDHMEPDLDDGNLNLGQCIMESKQKCGQSFSDNAGQYDHNGESRDNNGQLRHKNGEPQGIAHRVGDMVGAYKSLTTVEYIRGVKNDIFPPFEKRIWQRNYYERIIRDERSYIAISQYIKNNPSNWKKDQ